MPVIECDECGARYEATAEETLEVRDAGGLVLCKDCGAWARLSDADGDGSDGEPERPTDIDALSAEATLPPGPMTSPPEPPEALTLAPEAMERDTIADAEADAIADHLDTLPDRETPSSLPDEGLTALGAELPPSPQIKPEATEARALPDEQRDTLVEPPPDSSVPLESRDFIGVAPRREPPPARGWREASIDDPRPPDVVVEPRAETTTPVRRSPMSDAPVVGDISVAPAPERRSRAVPVVITLAAVGAAFLAGLKLGDRAPPEQAPSPAVASTAAAPAHQGTNSPLSSDAEVPPTAAPAPAAEALARPVEAQPDPPSMLRASVPRVERGPNAPVRNDAPPTSNESPAQPAQPAPFDATVADTVLTQAALLARNCKRPEDRSGMAVVTVTFSPSGRVTSANISGRPFAGTETGSCIASALRTARVPAFSGEFMTVKKTVLIQ